MWLSPEGCRANSHIFIDIQFKSDAPSCRVVHSCGCDYENAPVIKQSQHNFIFLAFVALLFTLLLFFNALPNSRAALICRAQERRLKGKISTYTLKMKYNWCVCPVIWICFTTELVFFLSWPMLYPNSSQWFCAIIQLTDSQKQNFLF